MPLYEYLFQCIAKDILEGRLSPGEKLPSKRALAHHLNIGVITVTNAYDMLNMEGYIQSVERKGYFVENLTGNSIRTELDTPFHEDEPQNPAYFVDFSENRASLMKFPSSVWSHYMREAVSLQDDSLLKPVPYNGMFSLRNAISGYLARNRGIIAAPSRIVIGAGTEYLYSRLFQLFGKACIFASEDPGQKKFAAISSHYGNPWKYIPVDDCGIIPAALEESGADVVHLSPSSHFPTGASIPVTRRQELFDWVDRVKKRFIIEDDYDSEFRYTGHLIYPMYTQNQNDKVIYLNTFSKTLIPSLRISYMILPPALMDRYEETMSFYSCTVSSFEQYALSRFISDGYLERHISRMRQYYKKQRAIIMDALSASPLSAISEVVENGAGTHFLLKIHTALSGKEIRQKAEMEGLCLSMYTDYCSTFSEDEERTLIINYAALEAEKISEMIRRLCGIFPEYR